MTDKSQSRNPVVSVRLSDLTRNQIDTLTARWGVSMATLITVLVDRTYQQETTMNIRDIDCKPTYDPYVNLPGHTSYSEFWLDARDGECGVSQEYRDNSTPIEVYHGHIRVHRLDGHPHEDGIRHDLEACADLVQRVLAGYESVWNGHNHVAHYTEDAEAAWESLCHILDCNQSYYEYWEVEDYIQHVMEDEVTAQTTDEQIREMAQGWALTDAHIVLDGDVDEMVRIATAYRNDLQLA
jgi:hypothetical protein